MTNEEILKYTGIEIPEGKSTEDFTIDEFKEAFDSRYITRENAIRDEDVKSKIVGEVFGAAGTKIKRTAKEYGIEQLEGDTVVDMFNEFAKKSNETYQKQLEDLKGAGGDSKKLKETYESKLSAKEGEISNLQKMLESKESEFNTKLTEFKNEQKNSQIGAYKNELFGSLKFSENANDYAKKGFKSDFNEKYKIDLDDSGNRIITDTEGKRISNPDKHGEFMTPDQVLNMEFEKAELGVKNPTQKPNTRQVATVTPTGTVTRKAKSLPIASKF